MVVRERGIWKPLLWRAEKTRSSDSFTAASGRPTRMRTGGPASPVLTSTSTGAASMPCSAAEWMVASIAGYFSKRGKLHRGGLASPRNTPVNAAGSAVSTRTAGFGLLRQGFGGQGDPALQGRTGLVQAPLHQNQIFPRAPAVLPPELPTGGVVRVEEEVAFGDPGGGELRQGRIDQRAPDAPAPPGRSHGEMMQGAAAAVVSAQHRSDDRRAGDRDKTHVRVAREIGRDRVPLVRGAQTEAFRGAPERDHRVVIDRGHDANLPILRCVHAGKGNRMRNVVPAPFFDSNVISPPCASTMPLAMATPSPVPPGLPWLVKG